MKIRITVRNGDDVRSLGLILDQVRAKAEEVKVFEAPKGIEYSYPFPVVTIADEGRHFGDEAVDVLRRIAG